MFLYLVHLSSYEQATMGRELNRDSVYQGKGIKTPSIRDSYFQ